MEIRESENTKGKGLFATKSYNKGEIVFTLTGIISDIPSRESIHIGDNKHILDSFGMFINHSFDPNIFIDKYQVVAIKDIVKNEELVFNYNETEVNMSCPFLVDNILVKGK
jgi:hypothetical protein